MGRAGRRVPGLRRGGLLVGERGGSEGFRCHAWKDAAEGQDAVTTWQDVAQVAGTVQAVQAGLDEVGDVADVMQPGDRSEQAGVGAQGRREAVHPGGDSLDLGQAAGKCVGEEGAVDAPDSRLIQAPARRCTEGCLSLTAGGVRADNAGVLLGFFAREWERACAECGYTWRVPRSIARRGIRGMSAVSMRVAFAGHGPGRISINVGALRAGIAARADVMEGFRTCAKCGADHFTQHPVRRGARE